MSIPLLQTIPDTFWATMPIITYHLKTYTKKYAYRFTFECVYQLALLRIPACGLHKNTLWLSPNSQRLRTPWCLKCSPPPTRVLRFTLTILLMPIVLNSNASASSASLSLTRTDTLLWAKPPSAYPSVDEILGNTEAVHGRIMVAEIAAESTRFARSNILVQSSASMTAQANQLSSLAFTLIQ